MNHYDARQEIGTKRWRYTCRRDREIFAVGSCDQDDGHDTAEEACACYRAHLIESAKLSVNTSQLTLCSVPGCGDPTEEVALLPFAAYPLCEDHMTRDGLAKVMPEVGTMVSS